MAAVLPAVDGPSADLITSTPYPSVGREVIYTDSTGQFTVGIWEASAYTRKLAAFKDYELMHLIQGSMTITNAIDESQTFNIGETFIINRGVSNAWHSTDYLRKVYCKVTPIVNA